ncbi:hypothetical protein [Duganella vulcania]|uniref:Uncharacterized protein n=1 Tax=Duganella vulcania TaxID=2692166 RepID=A0A845GH30_9BURK|nr:hypothetical protein [Duganella vulcania]MYM92586.1 hypothetical protein [Duganella vulcania]
MKPEDYMKACREIHAQLELIASQTRAMAVTLCANPSNPLFVDAMDRQDALLAKLASLDSQTLI